MNVIIIHMLLLSLVSAQWLLSSNAQEYNEYGQLEDHGEYSDEIVNRPKFSRLKPPRKLYNTRRTNNHTTLCEHWPNYTCKNGVHLYRDYKTNHTVNLYCEQHIVPLKFCKEVCKCYSTIPYASEDLNAGCKLVQPEYHRKRNGNY